MLKFNATIEYISDGSALISLYIGSDWVGGERIRPKRGVSRYEAGYDTACRKAEHKGGRVETYKRVREAT